MRLRCGSDAAASEPRMRAQVRLRCGSDAAQMRALRCGSDARAQMRLRCGSGAPPPLHPSACRYALLPRASAAAPAHRSTDSSCASTEASTYLTACATIATSSEQATNSRATATDAAGQQPCSRCRQPAAARSRCREQKWSRRRIVVCVVCPKWPIVVCATRRLRAQRLPNERIAAPRTGAVAGRSCDRMLDRRKRRNSNCGVVWCDLS